MGREFVGRVLTTRAQAALPEPASSAKDAPRTLRLANAGKWLEQLKRSSGSLH
jgi:hypothetical protein